MNFIIRRVFIISIPTVIMFFISIPVLTVYGMDKFEINVIADNSVEAGTYFRVRIMIINIADDTLKSNFNDMPGKIIIKTTGTHEVTPDSINRTDFVNGIALIDLKYDKAEVIKLIVIDTLTGTIGTSNKITLYPGKIGTAKIVAPDNVKAGDTVNIDISFFDRYKNSIKLIEDFNYIIKIFNSNSGFTRIYNDTGINIFNGYIRIEYRPKKSGINKLTIDFPNSEIDPAVISLKVLPGTVKKINIISANTVHAGDILEARISVTDEFDNNILFPEQNLTVKIYKKETSSLFKEYKTESLLITELLTESGNYSINAMYNGLSFEKSIHVLPGSLHKIKLNFFREKDNILGTRITEKDYFNNDIYMLNNDYSMILKSESDTKQYVINRRSDNEKKKVTVIRALNIKDTGLIEVSFKETEPDRFIKINDIAASFNLTGGNPFKMGNKLNAKKKNFAADSSVNGIKCFMALELNRINPYYSIELLPDYNSIKISFFENKFLLRIPESQKILNKIQKNDYIEKIDLSESELNIFFKYHAAIKDFKAVLNGNILSITINMTDIEKDLNFKENRLAKYFKNNKSAVSDYDKLKNFNFNIDAQSELLRVNSFNSENYNLLKNLLKTN